MKLLDFIEVFEPATGKLLFRFDPDRDLIEIQRRHVLSIIDLKRYRHQRQREREREQVNGAPVERQTPEAREPASA